MSVACSNYLRRNYMKKLSILLSRAIVTLNEISGIFRTVFFYYGIVLLEEVYL